MGESDETLELLAFPSSARCGSHFQAIHASKRGGKWRWNAVYSCSCRRSLRSRLAGRNSSRNGKVKDKGQGWRTWGVSKGRQ
jgi:hypothetical protein